MSEVNIFCDNLRKEIYEKVLQARTFELCTEMMREEESHKSAVNESSSSLIESFCHSLIHDYSAQIVENESQDLKRYKYCSTCLINKVILAEIRINYENVLAETAIENIISSIFQEIQNLSFEYLLLPQFLKTHLLEHTLRNNILQIVESEIYSKKQQDEILGIAKIISPPFIDLSLHGYIKELTIQTISNETQLMEDTTKITNTLKTKQIKNILNIIAQQILQEEEIIKTTILLKI